MPFPSPPSWRRQSRGSTGPRLDATSSFSFAEKRVSGKALPSPAYAPAHGTHGVPHAPRGETSRRVAALREQTLASMATALRVAEQTERVAGETLRELDAQSDSLGRTSERLDDAQKSAEESEKVLDELRSACGLGSCFSFHKLRRASRARGRAPTGATPRTEPEKSSEERDERRAGNERSSSSSASAPVAEFSAAAGASPFSSSEGFRKPSTDDAIGANAAALSDAMDTLRRASQAMGEKLDEQTRTVDDVGSRAAALRARLARAESKSG